MAPFPEDEIMTIKRLEVALKKSDFKMLKEGAYKLHEKYHSHHHFEYTDLLQVILEEVEGNYAGPPEIKEILIPTIQDILNQDNQPEQKVSSLTSLSYGINSHEEKQPEFRQVEIRKPEFEKIERPAEIEQPQQETEFIKPFQEFTPIKPVEMIQQEPQKIEEPEESETFEIPKTDEADTNLSSIVQSYNVDDVEDIVTGDPVMVQQNIFNDTPEKSAEIDEQQPLQTAEPVEYLTPNENQVESYEQEAEEEEESYTPTEAKQPAEEDYEEEVIEKEPELYIKEPEQYVQ